MQQAAPTACTCTWSRLHLQLAVQEAAAFGHPAARHPAPPPPSPATHLMWPCRFVPLIKTTTFAGLSKTDFKFPKLHDATHFADFIQLYGAALGCRASHFESAHSLQQTGCPCAAASCSPPPSHQQQQQQAAVVVVVVQHTSNSSRSFNCGCSRPCYSWYWPTAPPRPWVSVGCWIGC